MRPYGNNQECCIIDRKRRYLSRAMSHEDLREERRDKRVARAEGVAEINDALAIEGGDDEPVT
jgi:hypothetical protein